MQLEDSRKEEEDRNQKGEESEVYRNQERNQQRRGEEDAGRIVSEKKEVYISRQTSVCPSNAPISLLQMLTWHL